MAVSGKVDVYGVKAGADLSAMQYKAVTVAGVIAASSEAAFGLLQNKPESGEDASVAYLGPMKGYAGASITAGKPVIVTTSGFLITLVQNANSGSGVVETSVGKAIDAANSGDLFAFLGNFMTACNVASL